MKANAPEKIYINPLLMEEGESIVRHCTFERQSDSQVEYIRKDAFIEKAKKWIEEHEGLYEAFEPDSRTYYTDIETMVKDFVNYMKGE